VRTPIRREKGGGKGEKKGEMEIQPVYREKNPFVRGKRKRGKKGEGEEKKMGGHDSFCTLMLGAPQLSKMER